MDFSALKQVIYSLTGELYPGANVRVWQDGAELFSYSCGFSDEEAGSDCLPGERYAGYSVTKLLTCVCALLISEEGRLSPEDPLALYLPEFSHPEVLHIEPGRRYTAPSEGPVLIRHLFTMSAGFGTGPILPAPTRTSVSVLAKQPLLFEPGTRWEYGLCHDVLGAVLEVVEGKPLRRIIKDRIYRPLGLTGTAFLSELRDVSSLCPQYEAKSGGYQRRALDLTYAPHPDYDSGGAGIVTTADDYIRFLDALVCGKILRPETLSLMTRDVLTPIMRRDFCWPQLKGYGYGLGLRVPPENSSLSDCGWGGAAGAYTLFDLKRQLSMCFFTQVLNADETILYPALRDALYAGVE